MQTEKLPTSTPPSAPLPNGSQPVVEPNSPAEQIRRSDRLFLFCFLPAVVTFVLICLWLNYADIYGTQRTQAEQHRVKVQVYRPPVKHPKKKPPPPPKPKPPPPKPIQHFVKPPPPLRRIPPPPAPRAPSLGHTVHTNTPQAVDVGPVTVAPPVAVPQNPGTDTRPQAPVVAPPAPPPPVIVKAPPPPPAPVVVKAPPPPPPPPPKPKPPAIPDQDTPENTGSWAPIDLPSDVDPSSVTNPNIEATWDVDEHGHVSNIKFRSSGNSDVDDAVRRSIMENHFSPAVHNGRPMRMRMSHSYNVQIG